MQKMRGEGYSIQLAEGDTQVSERIQLFRVGKFFHPDYGSFEITSDILKAMLLNFEQQVRGVDIAVDYAHESDGEAAGWIKELELGEDGSTLWGKVSWTPKALDVLKAKEFRYISPEFTYQYQDNESLQKKGPVLLGAGLTNRPTIKGMEPVIAASESAMLKLKDALQECVSSWMPELLAKGHDQAQAAAIAYSKCEKGEKMAAAEPDKVHDQTVKDTKPSFESKDKPKPPMKGVTLMDYKAMDPSKLDAMSPEELKTLVMDLMKKMDEMHQGMAAAEQAKACAEKKATFTKLLSEGKACKAQEESFIAGDMVKFAELAQPIKLSEEGSGAAPKEEPAKGDAADQVLSLAHARVKEGKAKDIGEAISLVLKEQKQLHDAIYA